MFCNDCPYIRDEYDWKIEYFNQESLSEAEDVENDCYCEKVGGKILSSGTCGENREIDNMQEYTKHSTQKQKRQKRFQQKKRYKEHLKSLYHSARYYPWGVRYCDEVYVKGEGYVPLPKPYYQRCYRSNHAEGYSGWYKRYANKVVRRYPGYIAKGGGYKKIFDYWYTIT